MDGLSDGAFYQLETHALIISVRGVALDKTGRGYTRGQAVDNLRPICVGESMRRLAGQCQLLQLGGGVGAALAKNGQYGAAFKNGTDTIYQAVAKSVDAFIAAEVAGGVSQTDARNAFCSMHRRAMQRGILKHAPMLLPAFDFLYGPDATGSCYFYGAESSRPLGLCLILDGVQQGDVFGPLFFSLGLDELLTALRERMRDLRVDSTMVGQEVQVIGPTQGVLAGTNSAVNVTEGLPLRLIEAPSYADIDRCDAGAREGLRVTLRIGEEGGTGSFEASVPWSSVRLRAEILLLSYLDDVTLCAEAHLLRPFFIALRQLGPSIGLFFDSLDKNFTYVPRVFAVRVRSMFPDAVVVDDETPGGTPKAKLAFGAHELSTDSVRGYRRLLVTLSGIPKIMGAPLRALCPDAGLEADKAWLIQEARRRAGDASKLFAHLGLSAVSAVGVDLMGSDFSGYADTAATLPESDPQVKMLVTRLCLATRLNCLARSLPSAISSVALAGVDRLLKASVAGCAGVSSLNELTESVQDRSILASRFGGVLPGSVVVSPASYVSTVAAVERSLSTLGHGHGVDGVLPFAASAGAYPYSRGDSFFWLSKLFGRALE